MAKILFISPQPVFGGAATANMSIAKMLQDFGHTVVYNDEYFSEDDFFGLTINHLPIHRSRKSFDLFEYITRSSFDTVIWGDTTLFVYYFLIIQKLSHFKIRQIGLFHSLCLDKNIKSFILEHIIAYLLKYIDYYVFVSNFTKESWNKYYFIRKYKQKQVVIYNPVSPNDTHAVSIKKSKRLRLGFVGRFSKEKQPQIFCELSSVEAFDYCVFGNGPLLETLKKHFKKINFFGHCSDTSFIYSNIDILVMTSEFENCPMAVLESKVRGIPCVVPFVGGIPEIVTDLYDGCFYNEFTNDSIFCAINKISNRYNEFSKHCIESARRFTPSEIVKLWNSILN